jgi:hypothetical protein
LGNLGTVAFQQGEDGRAAALLEEALAVQRTLGGKRDIAISLGNLGSVAFQQGEYTRAAALLEESLALQRTLGDRHGIAEALGNLGSAAFPQGEYTRAAALHKRWLVRLGLAEDGPAPHAGGALPGRLVGGRSTMGARRSAAAPRGTARPARHARSPARCGVRLLVPPRPPRRVAAGPRTAAGGGRASCRRLHVSASSTTCPCRTIARAGRTWKAAPPRSCLTRLESCATQARTR